MKIAVCIKQIPKISELKLDPDTLRLVREGVGLEPSSLDMVALGAALMLREQYGGEVTAVTMGPPHAMDVLKAAHLGGADRLVLVSDPALAGSDTLATARALADALGHDYDLILCGKRSLDAETGQVGPMLAEMLGLPVVTGATKITVKESGHRLAVRRETETGFEDLTLPLPAVVAAAESLAEEVYISSRKVQAVEAVDHRKVGLKELGGDASRYGKKGSPTVVEGIHAVRSERRGEKIVWSNGEMVTEAFRGFLDNRPARTALDEDIEPYEGEIWVAVIPEEGTATALELVGQAHRMTSKGGGRTAALLVGRPEDTLVRQLGTQGAEVVYVFTDESLEHFHVDIAADAVSTAIRDWKPSAVLFPSTAYGRELASIVSARLGLGLTGDIIGLRVDTATGHLIQEKPAFGGTFVAPITSRTTPDMATVRPGVFEALGRPLEGMPKIERLTTRPEGRGITRVGAEPYAIPAELLRSDGVVLSIGKGVGEGNVNRVVEIARERGYGIGASRSVTDHGWLPKPFQVGLTGRSIAPDVYVALGVSGAFEHLVGLRRARSIVAVNNDPAAPIFTHADFGVVGSWDAVLPALLKAL